MPLPARIGAREGTIKKAHSGGVHEVDRVEEGSGEGRDGGVAVMYPWLNQRWCSSGCSGGSVCVPPP